MTTSAADMGPRGFALPELWGNLRSSVGVGLWCRGGLWPDEGVGCRRPRGVALCRSKTWNCGIDWTWPLALTPGPPSVFCGAQGGGSCGRRGRGAEAEWAREGSGTPPPSTDTHLLWGGGGAGKGRLLAWM